MHEKEVKGILSPHGGMNLCRGCVHGCIYCDSRSLCYHIEHEFEDVELKSNAPALLEAALSKRRRKCMIGTGAMSDPYQPLQPVLDLTREALKCIYRHGFGLSIQTKSTLILRDAELLSAIHRRAKCVVQMTLTTYSEKLCRILEPHVSTTYERVRALKVFQEQGVPTVVWLSPVLPFINDTQENLMGILEYCRQAGVKGILCFGFGLTLREGNREYFYRQLDRFFPGLKERYIREYGLSYEVNSPRGQELMETLKEFCETHGILWKLEEVFAFLNQLEEAPPEQMTLF